MIDKTHNMVSVDNRQECDTCGMCTCHDMRYLENPCATRDWAGQRKEWANT